MGFKLDDMNTKLIGYGLGGILVFVIVLAVERFNGPPPTITSLQPFSGQLVNQHISRYKSRIFADLQVRSGSQNVILFQQVTEKLSVDIQELPPGKTVTALIAPKEFVDNRTGLPRHSMWLLAVNDKKVFSYEEIIQFINNQIASWRTIGYWSGALGFACFIAAGLRRLRNVHP